MYIIRPHVFICPNNYIGSVDIVLMVRKERRQKVCGEGSLSCGVYFIRSFIRVRQFIYPPCRERTLTQPQPDATIMPCCTSWRCTWDSWSWLSRWFLLFSYAPLAFFFFFFFAAYFFFASGTLREFYFYNVSCDKWRIVPIVRNICNFAILESTFIRYLDYFLFLLFNWSKVLPEFLNRKL